LATTDSASVHNLFKHYYALYSVDSSEAYLDTLFSIWQSTFTANEDSFVFNDVEKELISIYKAAYQPRGFPHIALSLMYLDSMYKNYDYYVANCTFNYRIVSNYRHTDDGGRYDSVLFSDTIIGIRPLLTLDKPHLYLSDGFYAGIQGFLDDKYEFGETSTAEETINRKEFIRQKIYIEHYHFPAAGYHLITHPKIDGIVLNEDRTMAMIYFDLYSEGGYMHADKIDGRWVITEFRLVRII
jgi:hypothetical protein